MPSTDTRIVQMKFDNREFNKNVAESQESLEKFKNELDFDEQEENLRGFGDAVKSLSFDSMAQNLQRLADKFTGLGTVSELVISQIRRGIEDAARSVSVFIDSMTTQQIAAGQQKFDMLNKSVQTIKAATGRSEEDVYDVMKRLNQYTDQTSYNFADMAQNIGKFTSVGISLEQAERQMEGIANWAARSGAGINEASRAMYNLSQAMGVGSLKLMDWKSIENAGMATKEFKEQLIAAGIAAGKLEKDAKTGTVKTAKSLGKQVEVTYQNLANTLNKGWATKEVLGATLETYYWEDLYYEGTEALLKLDDQQKKIFDDMFSDSYISAAEFKSLQQLGVMSEDTKKKLLELAVSNGKLTKKVTDDGKTLYVAIGKDKKEIEFTMNDIEQSLSAGWFDKVLGDKAQTVNELGRESYEAAQKCLTFSDVLGAWRDQISTGWMQSLQHIFGNLTESMEFFSAVCNKVGEGLTTLIDTRNGVLSAWGEMGGRDSLWGLFVGEYDGMYEGAFGILDIFGSVVELVRNGFWHMVRLLNPASLFDEAFNQNWDENEEFRQFFLAEKIKGITEGIQDFINKVNDFFNAVPTGAKKTRLQMITDVINGVYAAFLLAYTVVKHVVDFFGKLVGQIDFTPILKLFSDLGLAISGTAHEAATGTGLTTFFNGLLESVRPLTSAISRFIALVSDLLGRIIKKGTENGTFRKILNFLGKLLDILVDVISRVAGPIIDFVTDLMDAFSELFEEGINKDSMTKFGNKLSQAIEKVFNGILEGLFGEDIGKKLNEFFGYLFGFEDSEIEGEATTAFGAIKMWFKKIFGLIGGLFDGFKNEDGDITIFSLIRNKMGLGAASKFIGDLTKIFSGSNIFKLTKAFGGILTLLKAFQMLGKGKQMFNTIGGFFEGLGESLKSGFKLTLQKKEADPETLGQKILQIAAGIALIAASIAILGSMRLDSLAKGIGAIAIMLALIVGFMFVMKKMVTGMENIKLVSIVATIGLVGMAVFGMIIAMTLLVLALKPLAKMNIQQIMTMLTGFLGIVLILGLFAKYVAGDMKAVKAKSMLSLALMALGMAILVRAIKPLAKYNTDQLATMLMGFAGILVILGLFISYIEKDKSSFKGKGMGSFILLAIGMILLVRTLMPLANYEWEQLGKMGAGLAGILAMLKIFADSFGTMKGTGVGKVILLAAGIWLLIEALLPLASVEWEQLGKMGAGLMGILLILKMFNSGLGSYRIGEMTGVLVVATSIWLLVRALLPLAKLEWEQLAKMGAGLAGVLIMLKLFLDHAQGLRIMEGISALIAMIGLAAVMLMFGLAMGMMQNVKWDTIAVAIAGLSVLIIVYMAMVNMINSNEKVLMKGMHSLILMIGLAAVIFVFAMALSEIKNVKTDKILAFSIGLSALLVGVAAALAITSKLSLVGAVKGILILGVAMAALMGVMALLMPLVIGSIGSSLEQLSSKLTIISTLFTQFVSNMSGFSESEIESAKRKFELLYELITSLKDASSYLKSVESFGIMLTRLGSAMDIYTTLTANVQKGDDPAIRLIERICGLKDKLVGFEFGGFSESLATLGGAIDSFVNPTGTGPITTDTPTAYTLLKNILGCRRDIEAFARLSLTDFTTVIQGLGGALSLYAIGAKEVSGLTEEELSADGISGAVQIMTAISESLNEGDGFKIPDLPTEADLKDFPSQLASLANAVVSYANACKEFDDGKADAGLAAIDFLGELNGKLTEDNVKIADKTKNISADVMARFGTNIRLLGGALYSFYDKTKDFGDAKNALNALTFFQELDEKLTESSIAATLMFEESGVTPETLTTFSEDIAALGGALQSFANNTKFDADTTTTFDNAVVALKDLVRMRSEMPNVGGIVEWFHGHSMKFSELADDITIMGAGLANLSKALTEIKTESGEKIQFDADLTNSALGAVKTFTEIMSALSSIPDAKLYNGFSYASVLAQLMDDLVIEHVDTYDAEHTVSSVIKNVVEMMREVSDVVAYWNEGQEPINMDYINMFARFAEGLSHLVYTGDENYNFYGLGRNIVMGVKGGIMAKESSDDLVEAAKSMIKTIYDTAMHETESASPSKLFRDTIGTYIAQGVAAGITKEEKAPADAMEGLVGSLLGGSEGVLAALTRMMDEDSDMTPTITPVLDLTNVQNGVTTMNGLFNNPYGLTLTGGTLTIDPRESVQYADANMPRDYTFTINQVNQSINELRSDVRSLSSAMSKMRLVMNTGEVVGAIGPEMDQYLGKSGFYSARTVFT